MYIPARLIGSVATRFMDKNIDTINFDFSKFVHNVLFSDHFILDSVRLREIPFLVKNFGFREVKTLLLSGVISLRCEAYGIGLVNLDKPIHRFLYQIQGFDVSNRSDYLQGCFKEAAFHEGLDFYINNSERSELIEIISNMLLDPPDQPLKAVFENFQLELEKTHISLTTLIQREILAASGMDIPAKEIEIEVVPTQQGAYFIRNKIGARFAISDDVVHGIIGKSIGALSTSHIRLFKMNNDKAFPCYQEDEMPVLLNNFRSLAHQLNPRSQFDAFQRVVKIAGLPQIESSHGLKISKILEIREKPEYVSFKKWISTVPDLSDEEIQKELQHRSSKLFAFLGRNMGKTIGHVVNIGSAYLLNPTSGLVLSYLPWLADKFFAPKGHLMFLYKDYPSIFD